MTDLFNLTVGDFILFFLIFFRTAGVIFTAPVFGSLSVPVQIKIALSLFLALIIAPLYHGPTNFLFDVVSIVVVMLSELGIGILIGYIARLLFSGVQLGGQMIGYQMGLGIVSVMDPQTQQQVSIIAQLKYLTAILLFLSLDGHLWFIKAIFTSFKTIEIGEFYISGSVMKLTVSAVADMFVLGVKVGAPIIALILCFDTLLGIFARTVPQMNVLVLGFPLKIGVGLIGLGVVMPYFAVVFERYVIKLHKDLDLLLSLFQ